MNDPTSNAATPGTPSTSGSYAWCSWHRGFADTSVVVQAIEQGSGPGCALYACADCREAHHLIPFAEQPWPAGAAS